MIADYAHRFLEIDVVHLAFNALIAEGDRAAQTLWSALNRHRRRRRRNLAGDRNDFSRRADRIDWASRRESGLAIGDALAFPTPELEKTFRGYNAINADEGRSNYNARCLRRKSRSVELLDRVEIIVERVDGEGEGGV